MSINNKIIIIEKEIGDLMFAVDCKSQVLEGLLEEREA